MFVAVNVCIFMCHLRHNMKAATNVDAPFWLTQVFLVFFFSFCVCVGRLARSSRTLTTKRPRKLYSALKGCRLEQRDLFGKVL